MTSKVLKNLAVQRELLQSLVSTLTATSYTMQESVLGPDIFA